MAQQRTKYQEKVIRNYYQNQDAILLQKLSEQVTELYLSEGKSRARRWQQAAVMLEKLKVPASRAQHIVESDNPALLASLVEELLARK